MADIRVEEAFERFRKSAYEGRTREMAMYGRIFIERVVELCFSCHGIRPHYSDAEVDMSLFEKIEYIQNQTRWLSGAAINAIHSVRKSSNLLIHCKFVFLFDSTRQEMLSNCDLVARELLRTYASVLSDEAQSGIRKAFEKYGSGRIIHRMYAFEIDMREVRQTERRAMKHTVIMLCTVLALLFGTYTIGGIPGTMNSRTGSGAGAEEEWQQTFPIIPGGGGNGSGAGGTGTGWFGTGGTGTGGSGTDNGVVPSDPQSREWFEDMWSDEPGDWPQDLDEWVNLDNVPDPGEWLEDPDGWDMLEDQAEDQPEGQAEDQPEDQAEDQPEDHAEDQPEIQVEDQLPRYVIRTNTPGQNVNVRSAPSDGSIIGQIRDTEHCSGTGKRSEDGKWVEILFPDEAHTGWVFSDFLAEEE